MASLLHSAGDRVSPLLDLLSLTSDADGSVVSKPGSSQLVTGQLLNDTDLPLVISTPFVKDHSPGQRNTKWMSLEVSHFSLLYGYAMVSMLTLL